MNETQSSMSISTQIKWIAELARKHPARVFASLHHVIDMAWLMEVSTRVRKDAAVGIDGQSWNEYAAHLQGNLQSLLNRLKAGTYYAPTGASRAYSEERRAHATHRHSHVGR